MLIDWHAFEYSASVPWPNINTGNYQAGVRMLEFWLSENIGPRWSTWAWTNSQEWYQIAVSFRWDQDRSLFVLRWS